MKAIRVVTGQDWDQTSAVEEEVDELDVEISEMERLKAKAEHYRVMYEQQQARVIDMMETRAEKTHISALDGGRQATVVAGDTVSYDEAKLRQTIAPAVWANIITEKVDRSKLEAMVLAGVINAHVVAECATIKPRKAFIKLSEHREQEPEG